MNRYLVCTASILASFVGGLVGSTLFQCSSANAQMTALTGSMLNLNGPDGKLRVQAGYYDGSYSAAERGQPLVALYDNSHNIRLLLRLAGHNESPVLVFKDTNHRDRMVIGLGMEGAEQEPFIAVFDKNGGKKLLTGNY
jgi:hypothetical protein